MTDKARKTAKSKKPKTKTATKRVKAKRKAADKAIAAIPTPAEMLQRTAETLQRPEPARKPGQRGDTYKPECDEKAFKLSLLGYVDRELAEHFNIAESTLYEWKKRHPSFAEAIANGKELADAEVAHGLYQRAIGMTLPDVHVSAFQGDVIVTPLTKHIAPDPKAAEVWLRNRQSKRWNKSLDLGEGGGMLGIFIHESLKPTTQAGKKL